MSRKRFTHALCVAVLAWFGSEALGADVTPPRTTAPVIVEAEVAPGGCATCQHGSAASSCTQCSKWLSWHKKKKPYQVTLNPGACFGHFQTQWRRWDEVCPYPYGGSGVSDAGRLPGTKGSELNPPRQANPMVPSKMPDPTKPVTNPPSTPKRGSDLPPIPPVPGKFNP